VDAAANDGKAPNGFLLAVGTVTALTLILSLALSESPSWLGLGPLAGFVSAIAARGPVRAAIAAPLGLIVGTALFNVSTHLEWIVDWGFGVDRVATLLLAGAIAGLLSLALSRGIVGLPLVRGAALGLLVLSVWLGAMTLAGVPDPGSGSSPVGLLKGTPTLAPDVSDEGLYLLYVRSLEAGGDYYTTVRDILVAMNGFRPQGRIDPSSPFAYRSPAVYALLASLPNTGVSYIAAFLALGTAAGIAAYSLARRYVVAPLAFVSAGAVLAFFAGYGRGVSVLQSEPWAGALVLVAVALLASAVRAEGRRALVLMTAAAAAAAGAALVRELAIAVVLLGLAATLLDPGTRSRRLWLPWAAALAIAAGAFALHAGAVSEVATGLPEALYASGIGVWWHPDGKALHGALWVLMWVWGLPWQYGWGLAAAGVVSAVVLPRRLSAEWLLIVGTVVLGLVVVALLRPGGESGFDLVPYYWAGVVMPTVLACVPLGLRLVLSLAAATPASPGSDA
jgi:hypothetical protein